MPNRVVYIFVTNPRWDVIKNKRTTKEDRKKDEESSKIVTIPWLDADYRKGKRQQDAKGIRSHRKERQEQAVEVGPRGTEKKKGVLIRKGTLIAFLMIARKQLQVNSNCHALSRCLWKIPGWARGYRRGSQSGSCTMVLNRKKKKKKTGAVSTIRNAKVTQAPTFHTDSRTRLFLRHESMINWRVNRRSRATISPVITMALQCEYHTLKEAQFTRLAYKTCAVCKLLIIHRSERSEKYLINHRYVKARETLLRGAAERTSPGISVAR